MDYKKRRIHLRTPKGLTPRITQDLDGVEDGEWFPLFCEMGFDLGHAADVSGGDEVGTCGDDVLGLLLTKGGGDGGLIDVVGSGRAAAEMGIGDFCDGDAGDHSQEFTWLGGDALGVGEMAGIVVGDGFRSSRIWKWCQSPVFGELREEGGDIHDAMTKGISFFFKRSAHQDEMILV